MKEYLDLGKELVNKFDGVIRDDRTGVGTVSKFGHQMRFDLSYDSLPLCTTKRVYWKGVQEENLWIVDGDTNIERLVKKGVHIWDPWATKQGDLGPVYGAQWRSWPHVTLVPINEIIVWEKRGYRFEGEFFHGTSGQLMAVMKREIDQLGITVENLKKRPFSRRHVISAWNVADLPDEDIGPIENAEMGLMALAPCHTMFQFYVEQMSVDEIIKRNSYEHGHSEHQIAERIEVARAMKSNGASRQTLRDAFEEFGIPTKKLSCQLYQRSADFILGVPFNIASYAMLTRMVAQVTNMVAGEFIHTFGDVHIYSNHIERFREEQMNREPLALPRLKINPLVKDINGFKSDDFELIDYQAHPKIDYGGVAV